MNFGGSDVIQRILCVPSQGWVTCKPFNVWKHKIEVKVASKKGNFPQGNQRGRAHEKRLMIQHFQALRLRPPPILLVLCSAEQRFADNTRFSICERPLELCPRSRLDFDVFWLVVRHSFRQWRPHISMPAVGTRRQKAEPTFPRSRSSALDIKLLEFRTHSYFGGKFQFRVASCDGVALEIAFVCIEIHDCKCRRLMIGKLPGANIFLRGFHQHWMARQGLDLDNLVSVGGHLKPNHPL